MVSPGAIRKASAHLRLSLAEPAQARERGDVVEVIERAVLVDVDRVAERMGSIRVRAELQPGEAGEAVISGEISDATVRPNALDGS